MTHYYYDPKTNTLHGPIDRLPPVWDYGFPPDGPSDSQLASAEADFDDTWKSFINDYLPTLPSHPHTFTGESRVVPEGEIEWRYEVMAAKGRKIAKEWVPCKKEIYELANENNRRRVAAPKTPSIPAHIVDDMKLDSYYDGFKDGSKLTGEPDTQAPGYTSASGEDDWYCEEEVEGAGKIKCRSRCDHCAPAKENNKDGLVSLAELEPGRLFEYKKTIALKTEYKNEGGVIEAFILGSGEMFWGGTDNAEDQRKLMVKPVPYVSADDLKKIKAELEITGKQLYTAIEFVCSRSNTTPNETGRKRQSKRRN